MSDPIYEFRKSKRQMTNDLHPHSACVVRVFFFGRLCAGGEKERERDADGCAKVAHQFDGRDQ
jgi:hypothetical protein